MRWPIILFKESSNQNMSTTTNKDDLVSSSPTQVRHTLRAQDVGSIWCCLCPEMVCPTVCQSVCTRESHYLFRPKRAGAPQVVFVDQSSALFRLVIDHLRLPTAVLGAHWTSGQRTHRRMWLPSYKYNCLILQTNNDDGAESGTQFRML